MINEQQIFDILNSNEKEVTVTQVKAILKKAEELVGLNLQEVAQLLSVNDEYALNMIYKSANKIKKEIYGNRIVLFAPLYLSSYCTNDCLYCGFRYSNGDMDRKALSVDEVVEQTKILERQGHKRVLLVSGEHPKKASLDYLEECIEAIYKNIDIRRINVNIAPMSESDFRRLKQAKIGTYQAFQETYHKETYNYLHPTGKKSDYEYRLTCFDRAIKAGIDDVGLGVLFGLYDYKFDLLALLQHANYLDQTYGVGPHTLSVPRLKQAQGVKYISKYYVNDKEFEKIVAILRLAVPYTGIILSTREKPELRDRLIHLGVSQISAGSSTTPGGYITDYDEQDIIEEGEQFSLEDHRSLDQMVRSICESGYIPSFCTACYRKDRTGQDFMGLAKTGDIKYMCQLNAILTFTEYLLDYGGQKTRDIGFSVITRELNKVSNSKLRDMAEKRIEKLKTGDRDLYF